MYASATAVVLIILIVSFSHSESIRAPSEGSLSVQLNLGAIVVALRARRKSNAEAREALPTDLTLTLVPSAGSDPSAAQKSSTISTAQKIANRHMHLHSIFGAKARQLAARQKAERDLLLVSRVGAVWLRRKRLLTEPRARRWPAGAHSSLLWAVALVSG